jgi:hypothetical protein
MFSVVVSRMAYVDVTLVSKVLLMLSLSLL